MASCQYHTVIHQLTGNYFVFLSLHSVRVLCTKLTDVHACVPIGLVTGLPNVMISMIMIYYGTPRLPLPWRALYMCQVKICLVNIEEFAKVSELRAHLWDRCRRLHDTDWVSVQ